MENDDEFFEFLDSCYPNLNDTCYSNSNNNNESELQYSNLKDGISCIESIDNSFQPTSTADKTPLVRYGRRHMRKDSEEYKRWRQRNNLSMYLSRKKKKEAEETQKRRLLELKLENKKMIDSSLKIFEEVNSLEKIFSEIGKKYTKDKSCVFGFKRLRDLYKELLEIKSLS